MIPEHPAGLFLRRPRRRTALPLVLGAMALVGAWAPLASQAPPTVEEQAKVHAGLYEITTSTADGSVWVAAVGSNLTPGARLVELDPVTLEERRHIDMGEAAAFGLAINNRTNTLYTSNTRAGNMSAVNLATGEVKLIDREGLEGAPHLFRVLVDEANNRIYSSVAETPGKVWVVNGATNELEHIIEDVGSRPTGLALDPQRNRLYVSNLGDNEIAVIDLSTHEVVDRIPTLGDRSTQLTLHLPTNRLFVSNQGTNDVTVIDIEKGRAIHRIETGGQPLSVAFHAPTNRFFVGNRRDGTISVYDGDTYEHMTDLEIGSFPNTLHIDESTGHIFVTNKAQRSPEGQPPAADPRGDMVTRVRVGSTGA